MIEIKGKKYVVLSDIMNIISSGDIKGRNFVNDLPGVFLVSNVMKRTKKNGGVYLSCIVRDKDSSVNAKIWDWEIDAPESGQILLADYSYDQGFGFALNFVRRKIQVSEALKREDLSELVDALIPKADVNGLRKDLMRIVDSVSNGYLKELLNSLFFSDDEFSEQFFKAPAASMNHHVRIGGLLEHSVHLAKICMSVSEYYKGFVNKDLLICGALIHDIGKVFSYNFDDLSFDMTRRGLLEDHIIIGVKILTKTIQKIENFPRDLEEMLTHIIVSHHGLKEWGSPIPPKTLEAIIIHNVDRLEAQIDSYLETLKSTPSDQEWSGYVPMLGSSVFLSRLDGRADKFEDSLD